MLTGQGVVAVAFGLGADGADQLGMAAAAAFFDVEVTAMQLKRGIRCDGTDGRRQRALNQVRDDLDYAAD